MPVKEIYCTECGNVVEDTRPYCSECGAEEPWDERPKYDLDAADYPIIFGYEVYDDNWGLWGTFCQKHFDAYDLDPSDIGGITQDFPKMKYCVFTVYFAITKEHDLEGPFLSREDAREALE